MTFHNAQSLSGKPRALAMWEHDLAAATERLGPSFWASLSDASVDPRGARSGLGAVALGPQGEWAGEAQSRGAQPTRDTRLAEIWGIEMGARLALEKGAKIAFLAVCDCQPAVEALRWAKAQAEGGARDADEGKDKDAEAGLPKSGSRLAEPSGPAKEAALSAARALSAIGAWEVCWTPREKLSRANDLARQALGLRPENKTAVGWGDSSWRPRPAQAPQPQIEASEGSTPSMETTGRRKAFGPGR